MVKEKSSYPVVLGQMDMNMDMNDPQPLVPTTHKINWEWIIGLNKQTYKKLD